MSKHELSYTVYNELDSFINREIGKRMMGNGGIKVRKQDIIYELAKYCEISWEGVNRIKRELALPSLPIAFKIARYFNADIEDIFHLSE